MAVRLTETAISKAVAELPQTGRRDLSDTACAGLRLRLTPAGGRAWVLACRDRQGRMRRFPLGAFPEMSISAARAEARTMHHRVRQQGADPVADARRERAIGAAAKAGVGTLAALLDIYETHDGKRLKSWPAGRKRVERVFKALLGRPVATLTAADLQMAADAYAAAQSGAFAVRTLRPALRWAARRGHLPEAVADIRQPAVVQRRRRVLDREELARLLPVLRASDRPHAAAMRAMLLTLARLNEVCGATWREIDLTGGTWTIPAERSKNGEPHIVPLSRQARDLFAALGPGQPGDLIFAAATGTVLGNWDRTCKAIQAASDTAGWHRHDLRRTAATLIGEMGGLPDIVEAALNHTSIRSPLASTYNRSRYRPQVAAALQRLADALDGIEAGRAQVVPMRRPGA